MKLNLGLDLSSDQITFCPTSLFNTGDTGLIWDFSDRSRLFSDAGMSAAVVDGKIGRVVDLSGNGMDGDQNTESAKPVWKNFNGKYYALFDGSDDYFSTAIMDLSVTDKVTVIAGIRANAATGMIVEFSIDSNANNGTFFLYNDNANNRYILQSRGTAGGGVNTSRVAPDTCVLTLQGDIAGDISITRRNGVQTGARFDDQGIGKYGGYPLYVGRRAGLSYPFGGQIFALIVIGRSCTPAEILAAERWVNLRTGAF